MTLNSEYVAAVMADSPWAFWQLQETAGAVSAADSANAHGGTYDVAVVTGAGPYGGWSAVNFNGSTQGVSVAGVKAQNTPMAFEMWAKLNTSGAQVGMSYSSGGGTVGMEWGVYSIATCGPNAALGVHAPTNAWFCGSHPDFVTSQWQYCVLQLESDNHWRIYITDHSRGSFTIDDLGVHTMNAPTTPTLTIGKDSTNGSRLNALVAAVAWYDHALTPAQIAFHFQQADSPVPPAPCVSRIKAGLPAVQYLNDAVVESIKSLVPALGWATQLLAPFLGTSQRLDLICDQTPDQLASPPTSYLSNVPPINTWIYAKALLWPLWCECTPATPTPVPPSQTWTQPTDWPNTTVYVINTTNPCYDFPEVRRKLDELLRLVGLDYSIDTFVQKHILPAATVRGASHVGLTGSGSFAIGQLVGMSVQILSRPPNPELEGAPNYVWDLGWLSIMDGNGFIQERRLTRDVEVWMPRLMSDAITFGYSLKTGVSATFTELFALP